MKYCLPKPNEHKYDTLRLPRGGLTVKAENFKSFQLENTSVLPVWGSYLSFSACEAEAMSDELPGWLTCS